MKKLRMIWNILIGKPVMYMMNVHGYVKISEKNVVLVGNKFYI